MRSPLQLSSVEMTTPSTARHDRVKIRDVTADLLALSAALLPARPVEDPARSTVEQLLLGPSPVLRDLRQVAAVEDEQRVRPRGDLVGRRKHVRRKGDRR